MEVHPGVFVSNVSTSDFHPDDEIGGDAEEHVLFDNGEYGADRAGSRGGRSGRGMDASGPPGPGRAGGRGANRASDGPTLELKTGDMAALPKGITTTWHLTLPFKEMWVLA